MAEIILAVLCLIAGAAFALLALLVLWANAMGGVTNAAAVNNAPAFWFAAAAIAAIAGGLFLIF
jgi:hypothetical protein